MATTGVTYEPGPATVMRSRQPNRNILGYLLFIAIAVTISAGLTFVISNTAKRVYTAEAQLVVIAGLGMDTTGNGDVLTAPRIAQTYATLALTRPILLQVISQADLPYDATELATRLKITADPTSPFITIAATDESPTRAESTANALADILVAKASTPAAPATPAGPATAKQDILQVVERAVIPKDPSGPRVMLNTALAAAAALILSLTAVAVVLYMRQGPPTGVPTSGDGPRPGGPADVDEHAAIVPSGPRRRGGRTFPTWTDQPTRAATTPDDGDLVARHGRRRAGHDGARQSLGCARVG